MPTLRACVRIEPGTHAESEGDLNALRRTWRKPPTLFVAVRTQDWSCHIPSIFLQFPCPSEAAAADIGDGRGYERGGHALPLATMAERTEGELREKGKGAPNKLQERHVFLKSDCPARLVRAEVKGCGQMLRSHLALSLAATTLVIAATLLWQPGSRYETELLMKRPADIRAVGDDGCLGRDCNLSSRAAKQDLKKFFNSFLDKQHGGKRPAVTAQTRKVHHSLLKSKAAINDLTSYYESLPTGKTARVKSYETRTTTLVHLKDKDANADMNDFYSSLPGTVSSRVQKS
jgi:hypothetical protein